MARIARSFIVTAAVLLGLAAPALAGTASVSGDGELRYQAAPGEVNAVTIDEGLLGGSYRIADTAGVTAGSNCLAVDAHTASCSGVDTAVVDLADGDDTLTSGSALRVVAGGGPGDDQLTTGAGDDNLAGGPGDDVLVAGDGRDGLRGGAGDDSESGQGGEDIFYAGPGADVMRGGGGDDIADYGIDTDRPDFDRPVSVSLDGVADDGEAGEGDDVEPDVEGVVGGNGDDTLVGNDGDNYLGGGGGDNVLDGRGGNDELGAGPGDDRLTGGDGYDQLWPGTGHDSVSGGPGVDAVSLADYTVPLRITLDDVADDGPAGAGMNIGTDIEDVRGGQANDVIVGDDERNWL